MSKLDRFPHLDTIRYVHDTWCRYRVAECRLVGMCVCVLCVCESGGVCMCG